MSDEFGQHTQEQPEEQLPNWGDLISPERQAATCLPYWYHHFHMYALVFLILLLTSACGSSTSQLPTPTPTTTSASSASSFQSTDLSVIVPVPAHPGDNVTVVVKPSVAYQPNGPSNPLVYITTSIYGTFPSLSALQSAMTSLDSTVGPPTWQNHMPTAGTQTNAGGVFQDIFPLPQNLTPGLYDFVVTVTLQGSQATARSDTIVYIVARA